MEPLRLLFRMMPHRATIFLFLLLSSVSLTTKAQTAPIDLEEAIRLALAKNYAVRVEAFNVPIAKAQVLAEYGKFDPSLDLQYLYTESGNPQTADPFSGNRPASSIVATDLYEMGVSGLMPWGLQYNVGGSLTNRRGSFNDFSADYFSRVGIDLTQPLLRDFGFGAGLTTVRIAKTNRALSEWDYRQAVTDTITNVIVAYHDLFLATQTLRAAVRSRDLAASLLTENERRFKAGNVSESDVTAAHARAAFREDSILRAERSVKFQTNVLRQLISDERDPILLNLPLTIVPPPPVPDLRINPAEDYQLALAQRPDYQRSRLLVRRQRLNRDFEANQRLPKVDLVGSYGYYGLGSTWPESRHNLEERDTRSYTAGAIVTVPLTFAQQRGRYRAASLQLKQAETRVEQAEQQVLLDVANVAAEVDSAQQRIIAAQKARELSQRSLADELKLHRAGKSSTLFVLQSQEFLSQAELNEFAATSDAHKAIAEYDRQLGRTLEKHHVQMADQKNQSIQNPGIPRS